MTTPGFCLFDYLFHSFFDKDSSITVLYSALIIYVVCLNLTSRIFLFKLKCFSETKYLYVVDVQWRVAGVQLRRVSLWQWKSVSKIMKQGIIGKKRKKSGKRGKIGKEKAKNEKFFFFFSLCPCWQIGLAMLQFHPIRVVEEGIYHVIVYHVCVFWSTASHDINAVYSVENVRVYSIMNLTMWYCVKSHGNYLVLLPWTVDCSCVRCTE